MYSYERRKEIDSLDYHKTNSVKNRDAHFSMGKFKKTEVLFLMEEKMTHKVG